MSGYIFYKTRGYEERSYPAVHSDANRDLLDYVSTYKCFFFINFLQKQVTTPAPL
jgi:hypothetical protein